MLTCVKETIQSVILPENDYYGWEVEYLGNKKGRMYKQEEEKFFEVNPNNLMETIGNILNIL